MTDAPAPKPKKTVSRKAAIGSAVGAFFLGGVIGTSGSADEAPADSADLASQLTELKADYNENLESVAQLEEQLEQAASQVSSLESAAEDHTELLADRDSQIEDLEGTVASLRSAAQSTPSQSDSSSSGGGSSSSGGSGSGSGGSGSGGSSEGSGSSTPQQTVHPGSFCSNSGATGVTSRGTAMVCTTTASDSRLRWRAAN